ncbi:MAG: zinc carboxypeptidase, partial [Bacteroidales bacterium]|nr:zinc carboxypeptidase [Bacteroidales bacterium]
MKKILICMLAILFILDIAAQEAKDYDSLWKKISRERVEVYFTFDKPDDLKMASISRIISIDQIRSGQVTAYANKASFKSFLKLGIPYQIQTPPGLQLKNPVMKDKTDIKNLQDWNFYSTYEAYVAIMEQFETDYPDLCRLTNLGTLPSGRKILALMITDNVTQNEPEPEFFYTSSMHGDEITGYVLMLRLIDHLLSNYGSDPDIRQLVNGVEMWINPLANPDGTYAGGNQTVQGATRGNANGIDINRNFPDPEDGPHPDGNDWQPETVIFMNFAEFHDFVMSCNLHGGAEVCNYPWDTWAQLHADDDWWQFVCREYADTVHAYGPPGYLTDLNNGITNGYAWYTISGGRQDYMNYFHSCREYTLEISSVKTPPASQLPDY